jgi:hypothetical protein
MCLSVYAYLYVYMYLYVNSYLYVYMGLDGKRRNANKIE